MPNKTLEKKEAIYTPF